MFTAIYNAVSAFTNWAWSLPVLVMLIGGGIWLTIACDFIQFKHFGAVMKNTIGVAFKKDGKDASKVSGWQAVTAALSATLGTGNIVGVGTAIALGGPGAVFWMWVIGLVAMALKYSEATLAVYTRVPGKNGRWLGGAPRYLSGIWKPMGICYAVCQLVNFLIASGVHTGSVVTATESLGVPRMVSTIVVCIILAIVLFGGLMMLVRITDKLVPIMASIYMVAGLLIIFLNIDQLLPVLVSIFTGAFTGASATGGFVGATLAATIKNGCARGMYSSDAGNGSSSFIHAQADIDDPVKQGMYGVFEVFFDTIVICTFTALVILCTGVWTSGDPGSVLTINAFSSSLGIVGQVIASLGLLLFAGSTVLAFCTFVGLLVDDMFNNKTVRYITQVVFVVLAFVGGTVGVDAMLLWADFANAIVIFINVIGMLILTKTLHKLTCSFFRTGKSSAN